MNKNNNDLVDSLNEVLYQWSNTDDKVDDIVGGLMHDIYDIIIELGGNPENH